MRIAARRRGILSRTAKPGAATCYGCAAVKSVGRKSATALTDNPGAAAIKYVHQLGKVAQSGNITAPGSGGEKMRFD